MSPRRAVFALAVAAGAAVCGGCGGSGTSSSTTTAAGAATTSTRTTVVVPDTTSHSTHRVVPPRPRPRPPAPDPGTLPQTDALPSADTLGFHARMAALWLGVQTGRTAPALPAFFPKTAYVQLKAVGDPGSDWRYRLVGDYGVDISAAHALLGPDPAQAKLIDVIVAGNYAHWVPPGVCYNTVGYYEVPNSRVVYRAGGAVRSFGIASMISWRGIWYVVHLGAILRSSAAGVVDDPESGPGTPVPSSTC